jgi:hypothetical protein
MSMKHWLISLRKKPKHVRENIAFGAATTLTAAVFVVWLFSAKGITAPQKLATNETPKAFGMFLDQLQEQVATVKEAISTSTAASSATTPPSVSVATSSQFISTTTTPQKATTSRTVGREVLIVPISHTGSTSTNTTPSAP